MVSNCANPACSAPFLYLHEGRIFAIRPPSPCSSDITNAVVERYWLCDACAQKMTLVLQEGVVVLQRLAPAPKAGRRAASAAAGERRPAA